MAYDAHWSELRKIYRRRVAATLDSIEAGAVDELDLHKLRNFCMVCLTLMGKVQEPVWRKAEKDAELASLLLEIEEETPP